MIDGDILELARTDRRNLFDGERLKGAIRDAGLDAVVAVSGVNVTYTGGAYIHGGAALPAVVTTAGGKQGLVVNEADGYYFREYSLVKDVRTYRIEPGGMSIGIGLLADMQWEEANPVFQYTSR